MTSRNIIKFLLVFVLVFSFSCPFFAEGNVVADGISDVSPDVSDNVSDGSVPDMNISNNTKILPSDNDCLCGREYYTEDIGDHSKYDCIKCGKNMYACTCNCWCGASSILDTSGKYGGISPRICSGCEKLCSECDCRDDKAEVLAAEKLRINGEVSPLNLPRPENGVNLFFALFTMLLLVSAAVFLPNASFMKKKASVSAENVDLIDVFSRVEEDEVPKKPSRAYETPEKKTEEVKRTSVAPAEIVSHGISVSEKINLPWITSGRRMIDVNAAIAKVIVNDSEVICGDFFSATELSEQLMAKEYKALSREARFPEFFGVVPETSEGEAENS